MNDSCLLKHPLRKTDIPSILLIKFREVKGIPRNHRPSASAVLLCSALFQKPMQDLCNKGIHSFQGSLKEEI